MVNVSFQAVDPDNKVVKFYAPVKIAWTYHNTPYMSVNAVIPLNNRLVPYPKKILHPQSTLLIKK